MSNQFKLEGRYYSYVGTVLTLLVPLVDLKAPTYPRSIIEKGYDFFKINVPLDVALPKLVYAQPIKVEGTLSQTVHQTHLTATKVRSV